MGTPKYEESTTNIFNSTTHESKSRSQVVHKTGKFYLKHNSFSEEIPVVMAFKVPLVLTITSLTQNLFFFCFLLIYLFICLFVYLFIL